MTNHDFMRGGSIVCYIYSFNDVHQTHIYTRIGSLEEETFYVNAGPGLGALMDLYSQMDCASRGYSNYDAFLFEL